MRVVAAPAEGLARGAIVAIIVAGLLLLGACSFLLVYFWLARRDRECDEYSDEEERRECEEGTRASARSKSRPEPAAQGGAGARRARGPRHLPRAARRPDFA